MNIKPLKPTDPEPAPGSVLMRHSLSGTAYQRFYSDGSYRSVTGDVSDYPSLFVGTDGQDVSVYLVFRATSS